MPYIPSKNKFGKAPHDSIIKKLVDADLPLAAEAFGAELDEKKRNTLDTLTCSEDELIHKVLKIADITADKLLAERAKQRLKYTGLKHTLFPAALSTLEIYSERFYCFSENGKPYYVKSDLADFPEWYNRGREKAKEIFPAQELENVLAVCCAKERSQKALLLLKLFDYVVDSEIIRVGYVYPNRVQPYRHPVVHPDGTLRVPCGLRTRYL